MTECSPELTGWLSLPARLAAGVSGSAALQGDEVEEAKLAEAVGGLGGSWVLGLRWLDIAVDEVVVGWPKTVIVCGRKWRGGCYKVVATLGNG